MQLKLYSCSLLLFVALCCSLKNLVTIVSYRFHLLLGQFDLRYSNPIRARNYSSFGLLFFLVAAENTMEG